MFTRILVPLETDEQAPRALVVIQALAAHERFSVILMRATLRLPDSDALYATSAVLDRLATDLRDEGIEAHYLLEFEAPEHGILDAARHTQADLILLMPHGRHGLGGVTHPSVTTKLLASAPAPLLIWPEWLPDTAAQNFLSLPSAAVILPLDGGELAERALPYAVALSNMFGRGLMLVRVAPDLTPPMAMVGEGAYISPDTLRAEQEDACSYLATVRERYGRDVAAPIQSMFFTGSPSRRILTLTEAHPGSLVVMSTHGRGALARATLGSVTAATLAGLTTPALVIPPRAPEPLARTAPLKRPEAAPVDG